MFKFFTQNFCTCTAKSPWNSSPTWRDLRRRTRWTWDGSPTVRRWDRRSLGVVNAIHSGRPGWRPDGRAPVTRRRHPPELHGSSVDGYATRAGCPPWTSRAMRIFSCVCDGNRLHLRLKLEKEKKSWLRNLKKHKKHVISEQPMYIRPLWKKIKLKCLYIYHSWTKHCYCIYSYITLQ